MDRHYPTLLLVEDDSALQAVLEIALSEEGFEVVAANSGAAALEALASDETQFQAVITDIQLGRGPNGWEVGHRARETSSGIPVIYMSGNSAHEWSANGVPESVMLQKPFVIAQLVTAVTTLLNLASSAAALSDAMKADTKTNK
ncbi:MAG TPA: response regulator [Ramlibacter sp.]|jgi:DNA-binding response OmpR family regulator